MNKEELKNFIKDNWEGRDFLKVACNKDVRMFIEKETQFMDDLYSDIILKQRAFFIINDITKDKIPLCNCGCGRFVEVNRKTFFEFRKFIVRIVIEKLLSYPKKFWISFQIKIGYFMRE
jgi:hypothetical protein